jgi:tRNA pseudouridine38-40 synthase
MPRYFARLAYNGEAFFGFQVQNQVLTVQSAIQKVLTEIVGSPVKLVAAGRTDRGVHAFGQAFHFDAQLPVAVSKMEKILNAKLAPHVYIRALKQVDEHFHARYSAKKRVYIYNLFVGSDCPMYLKSICGVWSGSLNLSAVKKAMRLLKGVHDFKAFCASGSSAKNSVRKLTGLKLKKLNVPVWPGVNPKAQGKIWQFYFCADGFLYHMIRNIIGTLLLVGQEKISVVEFKTIFKSKDRRLAGKTFASQGLCLWDVKY